MKKEILACLGTMALLVAAATTVPSAAQVVIVSSPANDSQVSSPVHYVASSMSSQCSKGISAMRIYIADHVSAYTITSNSLDTLLPLSPGAYKTVVQAWDNCGGVGKTPVNITVTATGLKPARFLYAPDIYNSKVWGFSVDPSTGRLTATGQVSVATNTAYRLASDKGGYRLYLTTGIPPQPSFGSVYAFFTDRRNGYLYQVPGSPFRISEYSGAIAVHPSGKFIFVGTFVAQSGDGILILKVNPDGSLTQVNSSPIRTSATPVWIVIDPWGKYLYVNSQNGASIDAFSIDITSGALTPVPGSPYVVSTPGCVNPWIMGIGQSYGRFLYTADEAASAISGFAIAGKTGTIAELPGSPWGCPRGDALYPIGLTTEPTGRFLYVMNGTFPAYHISIYSINGGNGVLTHVKDAPPLSTYADGWIRTDPSGKFLYALTGTEGERKDHVTGYAIDPSNGDLTALPGSPYLIGPTSGAYDLVVTP